jgi:hypothetical protein
MVHLTNSFGEIFEISTLSERIQFTTHIDGQPGKMTFLINDDPANQLRITNGGTVAYSEKGNGIFQGFVFTIGADATGAHNVVVYNQMRYLKSTATRMLRGLTASQIFELICREFGLHYRVLTPTTWIVPEKLYNNKTLYAIIEEAIMRTNVATGQKHFIRDNFGVLEFTEIRQHVTNLIIGENSLLTSYQYEKSIDRDTFNFIKIAQLDNTRGTLTLRSESDAANTSRWGKLQYTVNVDETFTEAEMIRLGRDLLSLKNRETQTMKLAAIRVPELVAGSGFTLDLAKLGIRQQMWVETATHTITDNTMELAVTIA